jgi:hypothetical protein
LARFQEYICESITSFAVQWVGNEGFFVAFDGPVRVGLLPLVVMADECEHTWVSGVCLGAGKKIGNTAVLIFPELASYMTHTKKQITTSEQLLLSSLSHESEISQSRPLIIMIFISS